MSYLPKLIMLILVVLLLSGCSSTVTTTGVDAMVNRLADSFPALWRLSTGFAYLFGVSCMLRAVYKLKQYGDASTMMSSSRSMKEPLTLFFVGAALMFFPTMKAIMLTSTFGYDTQAQIPSYAQTIGNIQIIPNMMKLVQLMGVISFIRGWIQLTHAQQGGQNSFGKSMTHIIGGLLAINIQGTFDMLQSTFTG